jgi:hypothetical protein
LRRSGRATNPPERFAEIDYDGLARATHESVRAEKRHQRGGAMDRHDGGSDQNMPAGNIEIDQEGVDSEEDVAELLEPGSGDDGVGDDEEDVFYEAREAHVGWACLCSVGEANDGLFAMLTGEAPEARSDPKSDREARASPEWAEWRKAQDEEFQALIEENVADVVDRPLDAVVLPSKFVFKTKRDEEGNIERYKARFVPLGCCDPWKALKDTFSPTLRYATLRVLIALAASMGAVIHQLDVKTAFLNGVLKTPVYVEQPVGYANGDPAKKVWRLKKALYGLVEAPRLWYETLNSVLTEFGFTRTTGDPCLYILRRVKQIVILGVFVDDFLVYGTSDKMVEEVKKMLGSRFKTKDLGVARWVLGMRLMQTANAYVLDQSQYLRDVVVRYRQYINSTNHVPTTPLPIKLRMRRAREDDEAITLPFRELLGSIGHLAIGTRIDIAFAVSLLSRFASRPTQEHWNAAIHVLKYLEGHDQIGLAFNKGIKMQEFDENALNGLASSEPKASVDSDFANDPDTAKSVGGMVVTLYGTAVSWRSKLLKLVATSTCHAEYIAVFEGAREIVWLRMLLNEIGFHLAGPSIMLEDNAAAKWTAETIGISDANKHIRVKFHWVRQCVEDGYILLQTVASKNNVSDALTKAPTKESLGVLMDGSGMADIGMTMPNGQPDQGGCLGDRA